MIPLTETLPWHVCVQKKFLLDTAMEAVAPGLYVGTLPDCLEEDALRHANITALVCCMSHPPSALASTQIDDGHTFHVPLDDVDTSPVFLFFGMSARFIQKQLDEQGRVLVFGAADDSCSVTIAAAYLITQHKTALQALELVRTQCPVQPNDSFLEQCVCVADTGWRCMKKSRGA